MDKKPIRRGKRPSIGITPHQQRTLNEIIHFIDLNGYPPTIKDLAEILGISGTSVHDQVKRLIGKGYLRREPGKARVLTVIRRPDGDVIDDLISIPIIGTVAAGQPIFAHENLIGEVLIEGKIARTGRCFGLEVTGDSMIGSGIQEGNLLIVRQQPIAESGSIVIALLGDDATVKRLYIREERIELRPDNPKYMPILIGPEDDLRIIGKVLAVRRKYA